MFIQEALLYYIYAKYNCNLNDRNKMVLNADEAREFFTETAHALKYINNDLILGNIKGSLFKIPRWLAYELIVNKNKVNGNTTELIYNRNFFLLKENLNEYSYKIGNVLGEHATFYAINYVDGKLKMDFTIGLQDFIDVENIEVYALYKEEKFMLQKQNFIH